MQTNTGVVRWEMGNEGIPEISQVSSSIIWVNGCFDVMHRGHIELLKYARGLGQRLIVGTDTDERIAGNKGPTRPINDLNNRIEFLKAIRYVDEVYSFGSDEELCHLIEQSGASIIVTGREYEGKDVIGGHLVKEIKYFDRLYGLSTTNIVSK